MQSTNIIFAFYIRFCFLSIVIFTCRSDFWQVVNSAPPHLFNKDALAQLSLPGEYPPVLQVMQLRLSGFDACKVENNQHQFDIDAVRHLAMHARSGECNNTVEPCFVFVPHCIGNKILQHLAFCFDPWKTHQLAVTRVLAPYFRAWVGQLRRAGSRAVIVLSFAVGRLIGEYVQNIPHVISYIGSSQWMENNVPDVFNNAPLDFGCGEKQSITMGHRKSLFFYPDHWPGDVVVHAPTSLVFDAESWRPAPANNRTLLFTWIGVFKRSCIRQRLFEQWGESGHQDVRVGAEKVPRAAYVALQQRSKYCLQPDGHTPWCYRFLEALLHGCVPVILSVSWHPPFHRLFRWGAADFPVLFVHPRRIADLHDLLSIEVSSGRWRRMQESTRLLARMLDPFTTFYYEAQLAELSLLWRRGETFRDVGWRDPGEHWTWKVINPTP